MVDEKLLVSEWQGLGTMTPAELEPMVWVRGKHPKRAVMCAFGPREFVNGRCSCRAPYSPPSQPLFWDIVLPASAIAIPDLPSRGRAGPRAESVPAQAGSLPNGEMGPWALSRVLLLFFRFAKWALE